MARSGDQLTSNDLCSVDSPPRVTTGTGLVEKMGALSVFVAVTGVASTKWKEFILTIGLRSGRCREDVFK